ncbi:MAG: hypothetical protein Q7W13_06280 [Bacteroidia bacterium]|nr:hypothetical protein [Bacteroidia bacterium]
MKDNTKIVKNSGILYIKLGITSIISLFTSRIVLQSLGVSDFGLYSVVGGIVIMANILTPALVSTTFRYLAFEIGRENLNSANKVFNIGIILHIIFALVLFIFAETFGRYYIYNKLNIPIERLGDAMFVFHFSVLAIIFSIFSSPYQALIAAHEKFTVSAIIEIVSVILRLAIAIILFYYLGNRLRIYALLMAVSMAIPAILYMLYCYRKFTAIVLWNFQHEKSKYTEMLRFSGWMLLGGSASVGQVQGAALIINLFFGTILNASFGLANSINSIVLVFSKNLGQAAIPQITKSYSSGNTDRTMQIVCYISKYSFFLMLLPALPLLLETDFILKLWLKNVPEYTSIFCQLMIINALVNCLGAGIPTVIQAVGKIKYFQIIGSTISLLSLPIAYLFFKYGYPSFSILIVYIVSTFINVIVSQIILKKLINFDVKTFMKIAYLKIVYVVILVSPLFFIRNLYPDNITRFLFLSIVSVIWFFIAVYIVGINTKERELIGSIISSFIQNIRKHRIHE